MTLTLPSSPFLWKSLGLVMWAPLGVCRCHGHIDITYHYHHHYGPICLLGSKTDTKDCRYYSSTSGYSSTTCTA